MGKSKADNTQKTRVDAKTNNVYGINQLPLEK